VAAFVINHAGYASCVWLCLSQAATDDPHIHDHHRGNAEYNQLFHFVILLFARDETGVSGPDAMSGLTHLDRDDPSDRNCSQRAPRYRARVARQMQRPSTSVWLFRLRHLIRESVSWNHSHCVQNYGVRRCHDWPFVGFCFAKIEWQLALHTRDGTCFREEICKCIRDFSPA
jgi:hypothetical protein